jgi:glucosamine kinase
MPYFLGFDAGGTKTAAALGDETTVLARATGGSIKPLRVSLEQAQQNISDLLAELAQLSGLDLGHIAASCIGTAGVRLPQTAGWMRRILSSCASGEISVCGDEEAALDAAFPGQAGVLMIAGTGSNTLGRTGSGRLLTVGGWGPILGDQGSGHWIGHEALRAALRSHDFGRPTRILDEVVKSWGVESLEDLINVAHGSPAPDFSQLPPIVARCAEQGDAVAIEVLKTGGRLLGEDAAEAFRRIRELEPDAPAPGFAFIGSVFERVSLARESMREAILAAAPNAFILPTAVDAVEGALWRARQMARA